MKHAFPTVVRLTTAIQIAEELDSFFFAENLFISPSQTDDELATCSRITSQMLKRYDAASRILRDIIDSEISELYRTHFIVGSPLRVSCDFGSMDVKLPDELFPFIGKVLDLLADRDRSGYTILSHLVLISDAQSCIRGYSTVAQGDENNG